MKVLVCGGHITPALATIEEIKQSYPEWNIVFVGRNQAIEGSSQRSEEYGLIKEQGIPFYSIIAGRWKRDGGLLAIYSAFKIPVGFFQAVLIVLKERPDAVISFGGYVALPVVLGSWIFRIPIVTHEQTTKPGVANRFIARIATKLCVSFPKHMYDRGFGDRAIFTGLPIRRSVLVVQKNQLYPVDPKTKLLFVSGGATGSVTLNAFIFSVLSTLLHRYTIVHQTGSLSIFQAESIRQSLQKSIGGRYIPVSYLRGSDHAWVLQQSEFVIGRAGANTVIEMATIGKIGILIPLPWSANNEQFFNAKFLADHGSAIVIEQKDLDTASFFSVLSSLEKNKKDYVIAAKALARTLPRNGARLFVRIITECLTQKNKGI